MPTPNGSHISVTFDGIMQNLRNSVLMMSSLTERNLQNATKGLFERDDDLCNIAIADDEEIDQLEIQIDHDGVDILLRYNPLATDLRQVVTAMKSSVNIERIADQAVSIARRARKLNVKPELEAIRKLEPMFALAAGMFGDATKAFSDSNVPLARSLKPRDKELDVLNHQFADHCTELMANEPENIQSYLNYIFIARSLERIGDHATNLGEDIVYSVAAEEVRHHQQGPIL
ncbi:MAG: phosphate signaling complex protein PhoU [Chthoniobacterales bacterium]